MNIPSGKPLLPTVDKILPYWGRIDETRRYSNCGPLVGEYESRIGKYFDCQAIATSSCTSAITIALLTLGFAPGAKILVPSYTFVGTVAAILAAGYVPVFEDIGADYMINPNQITYGLKANPDVKAILVVTPFGDKVDMEAWGRLKLAYNIPVIIDQAGGFDTARPNKIPVCVSTHATKTFSTAEGGLILCSDPDFIMGARKRHNYGIMADNSIGYLGSNAKLSEYHAAIGLAELDGWKEKREKWIDAKTRYVSRIKDILPTNVNRYDVSSATTLIPFNLCNHSAPALEKLNASGIEARKIFIGGVHSLPPYKDYSHFPMIHTEQVADQLIALPFRIDMPNEEMDAVAEGLKGVV